MSTRQLTFGAVATGLAAALWFLFEWLGLATSWDTSRYILFSQDLGINGHFDMSAGLYAPLYPGLLAFLTKLGVSVGSGLSLINAGSIAIIFLAAASLVKPPSILYSMLTGAVAALIALSAESLRFGWTEGLYAGLLTAAVALTVNSMRSRQFSLWPFLVLGILPLARFIGLVPAVSMAILLVLARVRSSTLRATLTRSIAGIAMTMGPLAILSAYNLLQFGCALGCRLPSTTPLVKNVRLTVRTLSADAIYSIAPVIIIGTVLLVFARVRAGTPKPLSLTEAYSPLLVSLMVAIGSVAAQIISSSMVEIDPIESRYYAPFYAALAAGCLATAWTKASDLRPLFRSGLVAGAIVSCVVYAVLDYRSYASSVEKTVQANSLAGFGYKRTPLYATYQESLLAMLTGPHPNLISAYFPVTEDVGNLSAYLILNSGYYPRTDCRPVSLILQERDSLVDVSCGTAGGFMGYIASSLEALSPEVELLIADKVGFEGADERELAAVAGRLGLEPAGESQLYSLFRR